MKNTHMWAADTDLRSERFKLTASQDGCSHASKQVAHDAARGANGPFITVTVDATGHVCQTA